MRRRWKFSVNQRRRLHLPRLFDLLLVATALVSALRSCVYVASVSDIRPRGGAQADSPCARIGDRKLCQRGPNGLSRSYCQLNKRWTLTRHTLIITKCCSFAPAGFSFPRDECQTVSEWPSDFLPRSASVLSPPMPDLPMAAYMDNEEPAI